MLSYLLLDGSAAHWCDWNPKYSSGDGRVSVWEGPGTKRVCGQLPLDVASPVRWAALPLSAANIFPPREGKLKKKKEKSWICPRGRKMGQVCNTPG